MFQILSTLRHDTCRNCGEPIALYQGDLSREPYWSHEPSNHRSGQRTCAGAPVAEPTITPSEPTP